MSTEILNDNFNSDALGELNGQDGWSTSGPGFLVQNGLVVEGAKAIKVYFIPGQSIDYSISAIKVGPTPRTDGQQTFYVRISGISQAQGLVDLGQSGLGSTFIRIGLNEAQDGKISYFDYDTFSFVPLGDFNKNQWYAIQVQWRSSDHKARFNVNGGAWSAWITSNGDWTTGLDEITISTQFNGPQQDYFCFDTFEEDLYSDPGESIQIIDVLPTKDFSNPGEIILQEYDRVNFAEYLYGNIVDLYALRADDGITVYENESVNIVSGTSVLNINVDDNVVISEEITFPEPDINLFIFDNITISEEETNLGLFEIFVYESISVFENESTFEILEINTYDAVGSNDTLVGMDLYRDSLDLIARLITSGYKWLTKTLLKAQQAFTVRPFFTAQVIDDSIKPTGTLVTNIGPYAHGITAPTPDDCIVGAGFGNGDNKIHFYKARDITVGWDKDEILDSDPGIIAPYANNQVAIAVSEMVNGSYHIDVAYFTNFNGLLGTDLIVKMKRSDDGGATWTTVTVPLSDMPYGDFAITIPPNLYLALMKPRLENGIMTSAFIYSHRNGGVVDSGYITYELIYFVYQPSGGQFVTWGTNVDSGDWTIHSFDSYYLNGVDYVIFSGFRNVIDKPNAKSISQNPNYALWLTAALRRQTASLPPDDIWLPPIPIIPADSASFLNQNQYTFPRAIVQNGFVDVLLEADTVDSISQSPQGVTSSTVTTHGNYMLLRSKDGQNFTYPQIMVDANNVEIDSPDSFNQLQSFVKQDNLYYICGGNQIVQFLQRNIVADISKDVIGYVIQEAAGQPSSIEIKFGNQNNQWVGTAPTKPGALAIAKNSKIALWQGYYNENGIPETVPRNVYYIDDITQEISGKQNDISVIGRDWFKKLKTLITRFSLQWIGPYFYTDVFDGTTLSNWNQQLQTWIEDSNQIVTSEDFEDDAVVTFARSAQIPFGSVMVVNGARPFVSPTGGKLYIYAFFIDEDHFLRLNVTYLAGDSFSWAVEFGYTPGGVPTIATEDSGTFNWSGDGYLSFFVRQYDYYKWNFMFTDTGAGFVGNPLSAWNSAKLLKNTSNGEFNFRGGVFLSNPDFQKPWAVGLGCQNIQVPFGFFRYSQFGPVTNILSLVESLSARAGIMDTKVQQQFSEPLINPSFTGSFTITNRRLVVLPNGTAINNNTDFEIGNGELIFNAKVTPAVTDISSEFGFSFIFRADNTTPDNAYRLRIHQYHDGNGFVSARFERVMAGTTYIFPNSAADDQFTVSKLGSLNFDITKYHQYKITMVDGWMYAYIDGIMVAAWNDNNTDADFLITGMWGFKSNNSNSTLKVKDIQSPIFWKPVQTFSFNPGDDAENAVLALVQSIRGWAFSDMIGRMKIILLSPNDEIDYVYQNQIWSQSVDDSDKEYISQVTVYGSGVMATARKTDLMPGVLVRDAVVVDYSITTQSDAQIRANNELLNQNQYRNQYSPKQIINVGSELFDAVTIINVGNNTSDVNSPTRVYAQNINQGGGNNNSDFSLQIQTGNL